MDHAASSSQVKRPWLAVASFHFALGPVIGLGYTCFAPIAGSVASELGDPMLTAWSLSAWTLASTVSFLICGYVSDVFGRRDLLLFGSAIGVIGFTVCAVAQSMQALIAGQTLLGLSTGFLFVVYSATAEIIPPRLISVAVGIIDCGFALPWASFAVLIANLLYTRASWRWIFYIGIILETVGLTGIFVFYKANQKAPRTVSTLQLVQQFDYIGISLFTGGLTSFLIGLMWAGSIGHAWDSVSVLIPLVVGMLAIIGAVYWDAKMAMLPAIPWRLLRQFRKYSSLNIVLFSTGMMFFPMLGLMPRGLSVMFTSDPVEIGLLSLPETLGQGIVILSATALVRIVGHAKFQLICLVLIQTVFYAAATGSLDPNKRWAFSFLPSISVSTYGWLGILNITLLSANIPHVNLGSAIALNSSFRTAGGAVGIAVYQVIFEHVYKARVVPVAVQVVARARFPENSAQDIVMACRSLDIESLIQLTRAQPAVTNTLVEAVRQSYGHGMQIVFCTAVAIGGLTLVAAACVDDRALIAKDEAHKRTNSQDVCETRADIGK